MYQLIQNTDKKDSNSNTNKKEIMMLKLGEAVPDTGQVDEKEHQRTPGGDSMARAPGGYIYTLKNH